MNHIKIIYYILLISTLTQIAIIFSLKRYKRFCFFLLPLVFISGENENHILQWASVTNPDSTLKCSDVREAAKFGLHTHGPRGPILHSVWKMQANFTFTQQTLSKEMQQGYG